MQIPVPLHVYWFDPHELESVVVRTGGVGVDWLTWHSGEREKSSRPMEPESGIFASRENCKGWLQRRA